MTDDPFREMLATLIKYDYTYVELERHVQHVRSTSWLNQVANRGSRWVSPPPPDTLRGFAEGFGTSEEHVAEMICKSWYGIEVDSDVSDHVRRLAPAIDDLNDADFALVERLIGRLTRDSSKALSEEDDRAAA